MKAGEYFWGVCVRPGMKPSFLTTRKLVIKQMAKPKVKTPNSAEAQRVFASLATECQELRVTPEAIEATLPSPLPTPGRAETLWRALQRLAAAGSGPPLGAD